MVKPVYGEIISPEERYVWVVTEYDKIVAHPLNKSTVDFLGIVDATGMRLTKIEVDPVKQLRACPNLYLASEHLPEEHAKIFYDNRRWNINFSEEIAVSLETLKEVWYPLLKLLEEHAYSIQFFTVIKDYLGLKDEEEE